MSFRTVAPGKWILAGEHSVLRGSPALVFPLRSRCLELEAFDGAGPLQLSLDGEHGKEMEPLFWAVLERACDLMRMPKSMIRGKVEIRSTIPIGAGLGASAAFCVSMTRWFQYAGWLKTDHLAEFARTLENLFHGESSGVDIAVALSGEGLHFERGGPTLSLVPQWQPKWFISYTGQRGITSEAVLKVKALAAVDPEKFERLDQQMRESVRQCELALAANEANGFPQLVEGLNLAKQCFRSWGLADGNVADHLGLLEQAGAAAVKPTGSGGGGYVLSLWKTDPPEKLKSQLIPC